MRIARQGIDGLALETGVVLDKQVDCDGFQSTSLGNLNAWQHL